MIDVTDYNNMAMISLHTLLWQNSKNCSYDNFKSNLVPRCGGWNIEIVLHAATAFVRELKQQRQQKHHKFAYLTMKNSIFARFARAFFIFWYFDDKCSALSAYHWSAGSNLIPGKFEQIFPAKMTLNNCKMISETRSYIFRWRFRFRRRGVRLSSLITYFNNVTGDLKDVAIQREVYIKIDFKSLFSIHRNGHRFFLYVHQWKN